MRITVLLPAWRAPATVGAAVADVLAQSWRDLELIVIHQGGDDPTLEVLRRVRDPRFHLLCRDEPGVAVALEAGRAVARGEWIGRMDADDRCPPTRLAEQVAHAERTGAPVVSCQVEPFPTGRAAYCAWQNALCTHQDMAAERFIEVPWFHATMLARPEALDAVGGWRAGDFLEDYDLVLRLFAAGIRQEKLPAVRYGWRIHPAQTTASWPQHKIRRQKVAALDLPADAYLVGTGRSLTEWAALTGRPALEVDPRRALELPPGFPVLVFGSAPVRRRLRAELGDRPHLFVA